MGLASCDMHVIKEFLEREKLDALIIELSLPGLDTRQLLEGVDETGCLKGVPIVITSTTGIKRLESMGVKACLTDRVIMKPFEMDHLISLIKI